MSIQLLNGYPGGQAQPTPARPQQAAPVVEAPAKPVGEPVQQQKAPDPTQLQQAIKQMQSAMASKASALQFSVDEQTNQTIVKVVDSETGEIIRQIPSEELVEIARSLDKMQGMLLKQRA